MKAEDHLIVALDVDRIDQARPLVKELEGTVNFFKIGMGLNLDPDVNAFVRELINQGKKVFLDYKYLDIEATIERAISQAARIGVTFLTIHHGNSSIMQAALRGCAGSNLKLLTVTVLTSMDRSDIAEMGYRCSVEELVLRRARQAKEWGCHGVVASGREAALIREAAGADFLIVTPGIRLGAAAGNDQKRVVTPAQAISSGADYLVVGRPIIGSASPKNSAKEIIVEMQAAFRPEKSSISQELAPET